MTTKKSRRWHKIGFGIVWVGLLIWGVVYVLRSADLALMYSQPPGFWLLQALILLVYLVLGSQLVAFILRKMGTTCSLLMIFLAMQASYSTSYLGPIKLGVPLRIVLFNKLFNASYSTATSATLLAQAIRIGALSLLAVIGVLVRFHQYTGQMTIALVTLAVLSGIGWVALKLFSRLQLQQRLLDRLQDFLVSIYHTTKSIGWQAAIILVVKALTLTALLSLSSYLVMRQFNQPLSYLDLLFIDAVSIFIGLISFMPMGLGTRDATAIFLLRSTGVPEEVSYTVVIVQRMIWSLLPFVIGLISANVLGAKSLLTQAESLPGEQNERGKS